MPLVSPPTRPCKPDPTDTSGIRGYMDPTPTTCGQTRWVARVINGGRVAIKTTQESGVGASATEPQPPVMSQELSEGDEYDDEDVYENFPGWNPTRW